MTPALALFIVVVVVDVAALLADKGLDTEGLTTITQYVARYPWLGVPLVAWQFVGAAGLAAHFWLGY